MIKPGRTAVPTLPSPADAEPDPPRASRWRADLEDLTTLAAAAGIVPLTWLLLGWTWGRSASGHDGLANLVLAFRALVDAGGDWSRLVYRADMMGGMKLRDVVGPLPLAAMAARTLPSPTAVLNLVTFALQVFLGFLGVRTAVDLATAWAGAPVRLPAAARLAGLWACAFAPVLGWRLAYGHQTLATGCLPFVAALAVLCSALARTTTLTLVVVAAAAVANGVLFTGHQLVLYGAIFGSPILAGLWVALGRPARALALTAAVVTGGVFLALPALWGVLVHAFGTDSIRSLAGMSLTYSYLTSHPMDWLGTLVWARAAIPPWRPPLFHHEVNQPVGPLLFLLLLVPWRRLRPLGIGLLASALAALAFAMNVRPVSDALLALLPPLGSFRVPTRAMMPVLFTLPPLLLAAVVYRDPRPRVGPPAVFAAALLFVLPPVARDVAAAALAVWMVAAAYGRARTAAPLLAGYVALTAGGVSAFRERLLPFEPADAMLRAAESVGDEARRLRPELVSPLHRVSPAFEWDEFLPNTALAARLSSIDGYYFPQRRFVELVCALRGQTYRPNAILLRFPPEHPASRALFQLYNVVATVDEQGRTTPPPTASAGAAWFSARLAPVDSYPALANALLAEGDSLHARARETAWLVAGDPRLPAGVDVYAPDPACAGSAVLAVAPSADGGGAVARVRTAAECPLTFALNYAENLVASVSSADGARRSIAVFPAYGALAAVRVPAGAEEVRLEARPARIALRFLWPALGLALLAAAAAQAIVRRP